MSTRKPRGFAEPARNGAEREPAPSKEEIRRLASGATMASTKSRAAEAPVSAPVPLSPAEIVAAVMPTAAVQPGSRQRRATTQYAEHELDFLDANDADRNKGFNLRFTAREHGALKFIEAHTPYSMHQLCIEVVREAINVHLRKLAETEI